MKEIILNQEQSDKLKSLIIMTRSIIKSRLFWISYRNDGTDKEFNRLAERNLNLIGILRSLPVIKEDDFGNVSKIIGNNKNCSDILDLLKDT